MLKYVKNYRPISLQSIYHKKLEVRFHLPIESFVFSCCVYMTNATPSVQWHPTSLEVESHLGEVNFSHINETQPVWWGALVYFAHWLQRPRAKWHLFIAPPLSHGADRWAESHILTVAEIYLAWQPWVWQVRCFSTYKQALKIISLIFMSTPRSADGAGICQRS